MKKISLDFDGVIYDLDSIHKHFIKENYGVDYHTLDATYWTYIYDNYPKILDVWTKWDIYKQAPLIDGALLFIGDLKSLVGNNGLQIVTSSPVSIQKEKTRMIEDRFEIDVIHVTKEKKSKYTKDTILMDDGMHNIEDHLENTNDFGILFDLHGQYGWNKAFQACERSIRAHTYEEAFQCIQKMI